MTGNPPMGILLNSLHIETPQRLSRWTAHAGSAFHDCPWPPGYREIHRVRFSSILSGGALSRSRFATRSCMCFGRPRYASRNSARSFPAAWISSFIALTTILIPFADSSNLQPGKHDAIGNKPPEPLSRSGSSVFAIIGMEEGQSWSKQVTLGNILESKERELWESFAQHPA